jgi:antitoxin component YwqK of YwqJK toxin-antitoxin module
METKIKRTYWSNGKLQSERSRVDGKLHGMVKHWYESGQLRSEYPYIDEELHGMAKWWHQDGGIRWFWLYNKGELVTTFYPKNETQRWKLK